MTDYKQLAVELRKATGWENASDHYDLMHRAADAIDELYKAALAMHTWIFLHTGDEQAAYDECRLSDEMNAALGYGGSFVVKQEQEGAE